MSAELAVSFKNLRINEQNGSLLRLDLERVIRRKNKQTYWSNYRRGFTLSNVSQDGHLQGLEEFDTGMRLRVKPFLLGGFRHAASDCGSDVNDASDAGLERAKYRITPSLTADFTWNTDFAHRLPGG